MQWFNGDVKTQLRSPTSFHEPSPINNHRLDNSGQIRGLYLSTNTLQIVDSIVSGLQNSNSIDRRIRVPASYIFLQTPYIVPEFPPLYRSKLRRGTCPPHLPIMVRQSCPRQRISSSMATSFRSPKAASKIGIRPSSLTLKIPAFASRPTSITSCTAKPSA